MRKPISKGTTNFHSEKNEKGLRQKLEKVAQTKPGQAPALDILKRMSMSQSVGRMCEQSENQKPKKFELRGWDFQEKTNFCHKWTKGIPRIGHASIKVYHAFFIHHIKKRDEINPLSKRKSEVSHMNFSLRNQ